MFWFLFMAVLFTVWFTGYMIYLNHRRVPKERR
jgi:hypothetical protein